MKKWKKIICGTILGIILASSTPAAFSMGGAITEVQAAVKQPDMPKIMSVTSAGKKKITVKWQTVKDADGYVIYRRILGQQWKKLKTIPGSKVFYADTAVVTGRQYFYTVRAYKKSGSKLILGSYDRGIYTTVAGLQYVKPNKTSASLYLGKTTTLKLIGTNAVPSWKSSNTTVATVSKTGTVTARKTGTAKITATLCGKKLTCTVTVKASPAVQNNYKKYKAFINREGEEMGEAKAVTYRLEEGLYVGLSYLKRTDTLHFFMDVELEDSHLFSVNILVDPTKNAIGTVTIHVMENENDRIEATSARIYPGTYTKKTTLTFYYENGKKVTGTQAKDSNEIVYGMLTIVDHIMKNEIKMSIKDLGFTAF